MEVAEAAGSVGVLRTANINGANSKGNQAWALGLAIMSDTERATLWDIVPPDLYVPDFISALMNCPAKTICANLAYMTRSSNFCTI